MNDNELVAAGLVFLCHLPYLQAIHKLTEELEGQMAFIMPELLEFLLQRLPRQQSNSIPGPVPVAIAISRPKKLRKQKLGDNKYGITELARACRFLELEHRPACEKSRALARVIDIGMSLLLHCLKLCSCHLLLLVSRLLT